MGNQDSGSRAIRFNTPSHGEITIYGNTRVQRALDEVTADMSLYHGVRLIEIVDAVYNQGLKDGRGERNPGRPRLR